MLIKKETIFPANKKVEFTKPENHEKPVKKSVRYAEMYRSQSPRGNQRNWNGQKSNQLGKDFVMYNKACYICGSFNHLQINCHNHQRRDIVSRNNYNRVDAKNTHPNVLRNMSPKAVLLKTGLTPLNTVRPVNTAHPKTAVHSAKSKTHFSKQAQSTAKRPFYKQTTLTRRSVHEAKRHYYTGRHYAVNTARSYSGQVNAVRGKPQHDDKGFVDSGCSRHMTGNIAYLFDFKQFDGGYVAFGGGAYGGKITAERRNRTLIEAARTMLDDSKLPITFWAEAVSTACYVQNRGFKPTLSIMRPFGCHVTILNTLNSLGKFDGKSDEGFFVGYPLSSKAFRVYNTRTRRVEENLHIGFLENKPMIEGNGPKWLFDIDSLTQSMNYVPVAAGTIFNESADASYFDSLSKDVDNGEPKSAADDQKQVEDNENDAKDKFNDDSSPKEVNVAGPYVNNVSPDITTGSFKLNVVCPTVNTACSYDQDSPKDMFTMGTSHTLEATHVEFFRI
ncbi:putative ribonuclease H-like domain-containing protein [Tanacetum coccineum]